MVRTPWYEEEIPFTAAAELGTRKVITDHSTIGLVVTADGSFGELKRENYVPAEEKTVQELKKLGKPFLVLLNSQKPYSEETRALAARMTENTRCRCSQSTVNSCAPRISGRFWGRCFWNSRSRRSIFDSEMAGDSAKQPLA